MAPETYFLEALRLHMVRTPFLDALKARRRHLESLSRAKEKALPSCALAIASYETGVPHFLLLYGNGDGKRYLGPVGCVEWGESPLDAVRRIAQEKLGLGQGDMECMCSHSSCFSESWESHLFTMHVPLKRMGEIADAVNAGRHPDFILGCVSGYGQLLDEAARLSEQFRNAPDSFVAAETLSA
jgi:hypothetical protein